MDRFLYVRVVNATDLHNRLYLLDVGDPLHPERLRAGEPAFESGDAAYSPIGNVGGTIYMSTDNGSR